jgi:hypothetical protein
VPLVLGLVIDQLVNQVALAKPPKLRCTAQVVEDGRSRLLAGRASASYLEVRADLRLIEVRRHGKSTRIGGELCGSTKRSAAIVDGKAPWARILPGSRISGSATTCAFALVVQPDLC